MKKILFVVSSHSELGDTGKKTGFYFSEAAHPYYVLSRDYEIDFVSPQGGKAPYEGYDETDEISRQMMNDATFTAKISNTLKPADVKPADYCAIFYAGGHGVMWDFPDNKELASICAQIYEADGVVGAVCHGPAGLVNVKLSDGSLLVADKHINSFTNQEETLIDMQQVVPFMLQTKLLEQGCIYEERKPWSNFVVADERIVTGQNPMSALAVGYRIASMLARLL